jgi:hypothetical protein
MSWEEKLKNKFIITCGDGKQFTPLWRNPSVTLTWNVAEFNFPEVEGTLVKKSKQMGRKFPLEFYFQGEDHLEQAAEFEASANNTNNWTINHPFYGLLNVQVAELNRDNKDFNTSGYTCVAIETIVEDNPRATFEPTDTILLQKENLDVEYEGNVTEKISAQDITRMQDINTKAFDASVPVIELPEEFEEYYNAFNNASTLINTATASPILAMRAAISVLTLPSRFTLDVKTRLNVLLDTFNLLRDTVENLFDVSSKQIYQVQGGALISAMCVAAATPLPGNYTNKKAVLASVDLIVAAFNNYALDLDTLQGPNGGNPQNYIPTFTTLQQLQSLVSLTIANLFDIALDAKSERTLILEEDSNIIVLTHRLYGLDADDNNINELIANNGWGLAQSLQIRKGTKVIYYI